MVSAFWTLSNQGKPLPLSQVAVEGWEAFCAGIKSRKRFSKQEEVPSSKRRRRAEVQPRCRCMMSYDLSCPQLKASTGLGWLGSPDHICGPLSTARVFPKDMLWFIWTELGLLPLSLEGLTWCTFPPVGSSLADSYHTSSRGCCSGS